ncbi:unannotated protein [freshwater metagenome]|uniref:Unannotated protein n=1 Tax=freshwater metagenome TaxID=449393 RepID=A0A6J6L5F4_9ZZZZ
MLPPPSHKVAPSATAMHKIAYTDDSRPDAVPERTTVAGPVSVLSAISFTGPYSVPVKYSVRRLSTCARTKPITTAPNKRRPMLDMVTALSPNSVVPISGFPT